MMDCAQRLKAKVAEKNTTMEAIANLAGMDRSTLYRKLRDNGEKLTLGDMARICDVLRLSPRDCVDLFWREVWH